MEVISKQIAFLSRETAGQPAKILGGIRANTGRGGDEGKGASQERENGGRSRSSAINQGDGDRSDFGGDHGDVDDDRGTSRTRVSSMSTRVNLYRRLRQGLVATEDLLPEAMLVAAKVEAFSSCDSINPADGAPASASAATATGVALEHGGSSTTGRTRHDDHDNDTDTERTAPAGLLHSLMKHVKPFSVCFDAAPPPPPSRTTSPSLAGPKPIAATSSSGPTRAATRGAATAAVAAAATVGDDGEGDGDMNRGDSFVEYGGGADYDYSPDHERESLPEQVLPGTSSPSRRYDETPASSTTGGAARRPVGTEGGGGSSESNGGQQGGAHTGGAAGGGGRGELAGGSGAETLRRAVTLRRGKRKLGHSSSPSACSNTAAGLAANHDERAEEADRNGDGGGGTGGAAAKIPSTKRLPSKKTNTRARTGGRGVGVTQDPQDLAGNGDGRRNTNSSGGRGGARGKMRGGRNGGGHGDHSDWMPTSLSWSAAKKLRKRMEAAAAAGKPSAGTRGGSTEGRGKRGRGRGGGGRKVAITLSDPMAAPSVGGTGMASGFGALTFVRSNVPLHVDIPSVEGVETYLTSLANPARDLAAMKGDAGAWTSTPRASAPDPANGGSPSAPAVSKPSRSGAAVEGTQDSQPGVGLGGSSTCVIDLTNIWRRTEVVAQEISQVNVKQSSLAKGLRESFARLELQQKEKHRHHHYHRHRKDQTRPEDEGLPTARDADTGLHGDGDGDGDRDGDGDGEEAEDGRTKPIDVETSMSVRLRYPSKETATAQSQSPPTAAGVANEIAHEVAKGGEEGVARMFALVVSLAHVHNISSAANSGGGVQRAGQGGALPLSSQLHVELGSGGHEAIVTAKTM
eukprot:g7474.t1